MWEDPPSHLDYIRSCTFLSPAGSRSLLYYILPSALVVWAVQPTDGGILLEYCCGINYKFGNSRGISILLLSYSSRSRMTQSWIISAQYSDDEHCPFYYLHSDVCRSTLRHLDIVNQNVSQQKQPLIWPLYIRPRGQRAQRIYCHFFFDLLFVFWLCLYFIWKNIEPNIGHRPRNGMMESVAFSFSIHVSLFYINKYLWGEFACLAFRFNLILPKCASSASLSIYIRLLSFLSYRLLFLGSLDILRCTTYAASGYDVHTITRFSWHKPGVTPTRPIISAGSFMRLKRLATQCRPFCWHLYGEDYRGAIKYGRGTALIPPNEPTNPMRTRIPRWFHPPTMQRRRNK